MTFIQKLFSKSQNMCKRNEIECKLFAFKFKERWWFNSEYESEVCATRIMNKMIVMKLIVDMNKKDTNI